MTRAGVLPMTLTSGLIAVLLAAIAPADVAVDWLNVTLAVVGIVHRAPGQQPDERPRRHRGRQRHRGLPARALRPASDPVRAGDQEAARRRHPDLPGARPRHHGHADPRQDWWIAAFALGGLFLSWAYTAPPLRLKKVGLGELDVLITWGPLMVGGVYYAGTGTPAWQVLAAATVYALLPTTVLMGKHIDKLPYDAPAGTRTFPVLVGERRGQGADPGHDGRSSTSASSRWSCTTALPVAGAARAARACRAGQDDPPRSPSPSPTEPPPDNPVWPLWWAPMAFLHTRRAGGLLLLGLLAWAIWTAVR